MNSKICWQCRAEVPLEALKCLHCGAKIGGRNPQTGIAKKPMSTGMGCLIAFGAFMGLGMVGTCVGGMAAASSAADAAAQKRADEARAAELARKREDAFKARTPAQHLEAAQKALSGDVKGRAVGSARHEMSAIPKDAPEAAELAKLEALAKSTEAEQARIARDDAKKKAEQERVVGVVLREQVAKTLENDFLEKRMNTDVEAIGPDKTTLRIKWVLTSKVTAHDLGGNTSFWRVVKEAGFKKVLLTDGYNTTFSWTVE